jgi:hypothetical protein
MVSLHVALDHPGTGGGLVGELLSDFLRRTQLSKQNRASSTFTKVEGGRLWHGDGCSWSLDYDFYGNEF